MLVSALEGYGGFLEKILLELGDWKSKSFSLLRNSEMHWDKDNIRKLHTGFLLPKKKILIMSLAH